MMENSTSNSQFTGPDPIGTKPTGSGTESTGTEPAYCLAHVSDADLLAGTRRLVGRSNEILAELIAHLAEVEARGIHRVRACSSLYLYCVYELRLSEDAAFRRARVARLARQFPVILQQVADGELHLTALVLLAPHLTEENHRDLLALAKHRTKREVLRIVRTLAPEPAVPDRVELLGPENIGFALPRTPSWRSLVESLAPTVRELASGDRPKDWTDRVSDPSADPEQDLHQRDVLPDDTAELAENESTGVAERAADEAACAAERAENEPDRAAGRVENEPELARAERYKVQFTASQEYVDLLERAQDLLSHAVPDRSLEEVHVRALRLLVKRLERQKYGAPCREAADVAVAPKSLPTAPSPAAPSPAAPSPAAPSPAAPSPAVPPSPPAPLSPEPLPTEPSSSDSKNHTQAPRQRGQRGGRGRCGTAPIRREVWDRDAGQCTYVDASGQRCRETRFLELHHELAHALGGEPDTTNLTVRCRAHNALAAEQDFGRKFMESRSGKLQSRLPKGPAGVT